MPIEGETRELTPHPQNQHLLSAVTGESRFARVSSILVSRIFKKWAKHFIQVTEKSGRGSCEALVQLLEMTQYRVRVGKERGAHEDSGEQREPMNTVGRRGQCKGEASWQMENNNELQKSTSLLHSPGQDPRGPMYVI